MDGKMFVEKFTEILEKVSKITEKSYDDWMIISNDPDCDSDYGVDAEGNLVIDRNRTNLKLSELSEIRYRARDGYMEQDDGYISLVFKNGLVLYLHFDSCTDLGNEFYGLKINGSYFQNYNVIKRMIQVKGYDWKSPFMISDHELVAYTGAEKEIRVPEGITEIGENAFSSDQVIDKVVLPETVRKIGAGAFCGCPLKEIDLAKTEVIEKYAFCGTSLEHITLPETVRYIGDEAFYSTNMDSEKDIENHSDVEIDKRIFRRRGWMREKMNEWLSERSSQ